MDMEIETAMDMAMTSDPINQNEKWVFGQDVEEDDDDDPSFLRWILNDFENDPSSTYTSPPLYFNPPPPPLTHPTPEIIIQGGQIQHQSQRQELYRNEEEEEVAVVTEELFRAAEMVEKGDSLMAEGILARLTNHLPPLGKPFHRAAFSLKQNLQHLLLFPREESNNSSVFSFTCSHSSTLLHILCAYKSFSEISPVIQFATFTSTQSLLEQLHSHERIHLLDFDIGFGWHWASFMQELSLRNTSSLKITAVVYPTVQGQVELGLVRRNLTQFAEELKLDFELEMVNSEESLHLLAGARGEAIGVNIPMECSLMGRLPPLQLLLRMMKQASVKVVVCMERGGGGDGEEMSFAENVMCSFQWYWAMLESVEAVSGRGDVVQKIERFILEKEVERRVLGLRRRLMEKRVLPWRKLFLSFGFSPLTFSNFCESQAEMLVKRSVAPSWFRVERRRLSLVLCWQRKELVSVSAWRC